MAAVGAADGAVCVDHRRLDEFLHHVSGEEVRATIVSGRLRLRVNAASLDLPVYGEDVLVLPRIQPRETVTLRAGPFVRSLRRVFAGAHEDIGQPALCGVKMTCTASAIIAEACDGKRFARAEERSEAAPFVATLNRRFVSKVLSVAQRGEKLVLRQDDNFVTADVGTVRIIGQRILAAFPGLGATMDGAATATCELDRDLLLAAIDTVRSVGDEAPLRLSVHSAEGTPRYRSHATYKATLRRAS
jgi:DNA polymerase III sliding clamp (beta) subunit (PCNA family)